MRKTDKLAAVHIDEIVDVSIANNPYYTANLQHQWLDQNGLLHRTAYVINAVNGGVYKLTVDIAKAKDGRHILYTTKGRIKRVGNAKVNSLIIRGSTLNSNSTKTIPYPRATVKVRIADVTYSRQFEKWFGNWQTNPDNASKVVNADGTPKLMYHGTRAENGNMILYDILKINPTQFTVKEMDAAITANPSPEADRNTASISKNTIAQDDETVNEQFSISAKKRELRKRAYGVS